MIMAVAVTAVGVLGSTLKGGVLEGDKQGTR